MKIKSSSLVYSCQSGRICPACGKPVSGCRCRAQVPVARQGDGVVRVGRESQGRKGKGVTLISGVPLSGEELKGLARELKQKCGVGGTLKEGVIEIQGDRRDEVIELLKGRGWPVKRVGG